MENLANSWCRSGFDLAISKRILPVFSNAAIRAAAKDYIAELGYGRREYRSRSLRSAIYGAASTSLLRTSRRLLRRFTRSAPNL